MPKTGTTAIQIYLKNNNEQLRQYNLVFPQDYMDSNVQQELLLSCGNLSNYFFDSDDKGKERLINDIIKKYNTDIILASERIWADLAMHGTSFLSKLKEMCRDSQIIIICYLRRQVDFFESMYLEEVKFGKETRNLPEIYASVGDIYTSENANIQQLNYKKILLELVELFGKENCYFRLYEKNKWKNQNILEDFMDILGVKDCSQFYEIKEKLNPSIDSQTAFLKKEINKIPYSRKDILNAFFIPSVRSSENHKNSRKQEYKLSLLSDSKKRTFMEKYAEDNAWIAKTYFDSETLFEEIGGAENGYIASSSDLIQEMIYVFSSVIVEHNNAIKALHEKINKINEDGQCNLLQIAQLKEQLMAESERSQLLQQEKEMLLNSTSWKITAPMRKIKESIFKRF